MRVKPLRVAVVGCGAMGSLHRRVYQELEDVELVAVVDTDRAVVESNEAAGIAGFESLQKMIEGTAPDLVSVAVPTEFHAEVASELVESSIAVLVEKPLTGNLDSARALVELAANHNVTLAVGHTERFNPAVVELERLAREGKIGDALRISSRRFGPIPARENSDGVIFDLASHDLDLVRSLLPEDPPVWIEAQFTRVPGNRLSETVKCVMQLLSGALWTLEAGWTDSPKVRILEISTSSGAFTCDLLAQSLVWRHEPHATPGLSDETLSSAGIEPLKAEIADFVSAVRERREPRVTGRDASEAVRLAELIAEAVERGTRIQIG